MTKVFLTGGTGFIGRPLAQALLARGWEVIALVRRPASPQARALAAMGAQCVAGDLTDRASMRAPMHGCDIVVHNAAIYEYGVDKAGEQRMQQVNVGGTRHVLELAEELQIARTVYVSTVIAFGDTGAQLRDESFTRQVPCRTAYEQSKTDAHALALACQQRGLPLIITCPSAVVGPNDHSPWGYFLRMYLNRVMPPLAWAANTIHGCVEVHDLAEGIALAAEKGRLGETYILSGEPQSFRKNVEAWSRRPGALRSRLWLPTRLAAPLFAPLEPLQRALGLPAFISRETVYASATNMHLSNAKARRELGWQPRSATEMWDATLDGEIELLARRKGQTLLQRLRPLDTVD